MARSSGSRVLWCLVLLLLIDARRLRGQEADATLESINPPVLGHPDPGLNQAVRSAVADAAVKLQNPQCMRIFSDFSDGGGRTLQHNLDERGETGRGFLRWLIFYNGHAEGSCTKDARVAATNPGDRFIHICPDRFREAQFLTPGYAAALIIHEELHALGLKENPPTSRAITIAVISRCGA